MILAALAAASVLGAAAPGPCATALCGAPALAPFFDALSVRSGFDGAPPVHILQLGDSHTAGDAIAGAWRDILQGRYRSGGRGVLPPGDPYYGFRPHGVHVTQSDGWRNEAIFGKAAPADPGAVFGISGFRLTSERPGASITLTADPAEAFSRVVVCAVTGPGAGAYVLQIGGASERVALDGPPGVACRQVSEPQPETTASITAEGAAVTLLSWGTFAQGGVAVSNLGVVGAQLRHFARVDSGAMARELRAYAPDLIVLAFGTNEGFEGRLDETDYEWVLRAQITRLKRLSGGAPILVLGAPDAGADRPALAHNVTPRAGDPAPPTQGGWFPPPALARVREIQRRVAAEEGVAFWDWGARMGGPGTAEAWASMTPPLMRRDRVHYTTEGGAEIARLLQQDLDAAATGGAAP
ncbi:MAG TPA: GDSL-type esterase/lipase family protein [Caulobacteraceae bacterium]|nr:GDSL-type esterase/lipase family protein [Caulobacteraceae bacterium]